MGRARKSVGRRRRLLHIRLSQGRGGWVVVQGGMNGGRMVIQLAWRWRRGFVTVCDGNLV